MNTLLKPLSRLRDALWLAIDRWRDTIADDPWDGHTSEIGATDGSWPTAGGFAWQSYPKPHNKTICLGRENDFTIS